MKRYRTGIKLLFLKPCSLRIDIQTKQRKFFILFIFSAEEGIQGLECSVSQVLYYIAKPSTPNLLYILRHCHKADLEIILQPRQTSDLQPSSISLSSKQQELQACEKQTQLIKIFLKTTITNKRIFYDGNVIKQQHMNALVTNIFIQEIVCFHYIKKAHLKCIKLVNILKPMVKKNKIG